MPEKSVREMNRLQRQHYSLSTRVFRASLLGSVILALAALIIGVGLYSYALLQQHTVEAYHLTQNAGMMLGRVTSIDNLTRETMERYRGLSEAERAQVGTEAYRARFADLEQRQSFRNAVDLLTYFKEDSDLFDIYIAMFDEETSAIVYIADPETEPEYVCRPGDWERVKKREIKRFLHPEGTDISYDVGRTEEYGWMCTAGVPLRDKDGNVIAFVLADITAGNLIDEVRRFFLQYAAAMLLLGLVIAIVVARRMRRRLVEPINQIAEAAQNYVNDKRSGVAATDHFAMLNIRTGDEIENLSLVMADMERDLSEYTENLISATAEKERIGTELALATRIQADFLPNIFPAFPDRSDFDVYASMRPAKEVGGDFYDFFLVDEDHLGLVMADVSGKGVPAALFMMVAKILVKNHLMSGLTPGQTLELFNRQICANNREEMFITIWLGVLDLTSGRIVAANAGHEYPALKTPDGDFVLAKGRNGFVVGGMEGMKYHDDTLQLDPGAKLFLYTDGVPEAMNVNGTLFGKERMVQALRQAQDGTPEQILKEVDAAVSDFAADAPQFDDLTMLCVHYLGRKEKGERIVKELTVLATLENIVPVTDFINEELEKLNCPIKAQMQIDVAVDELFGNIARYAYDPDTGPATVRVEVDPDQMIVSITFIDHGKPYDPLSTKAPDITAPVEERPIGGLGIFLVRKTMDDVAYEYRNGKNILRIKKKM